VSTKLQCRRVRGLSHLPPLLQRNTPLQQSRERFVLLHTISRAISGDFAHILCTNPNETDCGPFHIIPNVIQYREISKEVCWQ
jgi:hypothetical protein